MESDKLMMTTQDKSKNPVLHSTDWGGQEKHAAEGQKRDVSPTSVDDDDGDDDDEDESESTGSETELGSDSEEEDEEQDGEEGEEVGEPVKTNDDSKELKKTQREESDPALTELLRDELRKIIPTEIRKIIQEEFKNRDADQDEKAILDPSEEQYQQRQPEKEFSRKPPLSASLSTSSLPSSRAVCTTGLDRSVPSLASTELVSAQSPTLSSHMSAVGSVKSPSSSPHLQRARFSDDVSTGVRTDALDPDVPGHQNDSSNDFVRAKTVESKWGQLFDDQGRDTHRLQQILSGLATYIVDELQPQKSLVVTPAKLAAFYSHNALPAEKFPFQRIFGASTPESHARIADLYSDLGCAYHLVQADSNSRPAVPGLTPYGFTQWLTINIRANPDEEALRLNKVCSTLPVIAANELSGRTERLPEQLPRHLLPAAPHWRSSWLLNEGIKDLLEEISASVAKEKPAVASDTRPRPQGTGPGLLLRSSSESTPRLDTGSNTSLFRGMPPPPPPFPQPPLSPARRAPPGYTWKRSPPASMSMPSNPHRNSVPANFGTSPARTDYALPSLSPASSRASIALPGKRGSPVREASPRDSGMGERERPRERERDKERPVVRDRDRRDDHRRNPRRGSFDHARSGSSASTPYLPLEGKRGEEKRIHRRSFVLPGERAQGETWDDVLRGKHGGATRL